MLQVTDPWACKNARVVKRLRAQNGEKDPAAKKSCVMRKFFLWNVRLALSTSLFLGVD